jgi:hypothetical protein
MAISQKDIKILWGRSGNRCAICKMILTQDEKAEKSPYTLGEQAHIVGEKEAAARGKSLLTIEERNTYHNLILLCPNHHKIIDSNEADWPIEKLFSTKSAHELWVSETLSSSDQFFLAKQVAITNIIDAAVNYCSLENWTYWTSFGLTLNPAWSKIQIDNIAEFHRKVLYTIWPDGYQELQRATETLSASLNIAANTFLKHSRFHNGTYHSVKFYKNNGWNNNYDAEHDLYNQWIESCHESLREATKAANWFADVVRNEVNPMFLVANGRFLTVEGDTLGFDHFLYRYTDEQRALLPGALKIASDQDI